MSIEGAPVERVDDTERTRLMKEASVVARTRVATLSKDLPDPVMARMMGGMQFKLKDPAIEERRRSLEQWKQEAEKNERVAATLYDTQKDMEGKTKDELSAMLQEAILAEKREPSIETTIRAEVIRNTLREKSRWMSWLRN
mgnify:FL=1